MKKIDRYRLILLSLTCLLGVILSSCTASGEVPQTDKPKSTGGFVATELAIPDAAPKTWAKDIDACPFKSSTVILRNIQDENGNSCGEVLLTSDEGTSSLPLKTGSGDPLFATALFSNDENLYILGSDMQTGGNVLLQLDSDSNSLNTIMTIPASAIGSLNDFVVEGDTTVLLCGETLCAYKAGVVTGQSAIPGSLLSEKIIVNNGIVEYLYCDTGGNYLGSWDIETGKASQQQLTALSGISLIGWCPSSDAFYAETTSGIFLLSSAEQLQQILSWNDTDLPPSRYAYNTTADFVLSSERILRIVSPVSSQTTEGAEYQLLRHTDVSPSAGKTILTIGGYGASQDTILKYAVYRFNQENTVYRIEVLDYSEEYPFSDAASYDQAITNIIADMANGKGQDILYGTLAFNYNKLDANGLLLDMKPYLDKDPELSASAWLSSMYQLMEKNGSLYFFFPAFSIRGYVTNQSYFPGLDSIHCEDIVAKTVDTSFSGTVFSGVKSADLLRGALLYSLDSYRDESGKFNITAEQLAGLIQYAKSAGTVDTSGANAQPEKSYLIGQQAMLYAYIFCPQDYYRYQQLGSDVTLYVGYPSQGDSARLCSPVDITAISSGTEYPDACWEFMKTMMSPEVQQKAIELNSIPVSATAFEDLLNKAKYPELRSPAENTALELTTQMAIPDSSISDFRNLVDSINAMEYYDTSLSAIIDEVCAPCLTGDKSAEDIVSELNSRLNLYLSE